MTSGQFFSNYFEGSNPKETSSNNVFFHYFGVFPQRCPSKMSNVQQKFRAKKKSWEFSQQVRAYVGVGLGLGSLALPVWVLLPIFIDNKIAQDPNLPGLTEETLTITTTDTWTFFMGVRSAGGDDDDGGGDDAAASGGCGADGGRVLGKSILTNSEPVFWWEIEELPCYMMWFFSASAKAIFAGWMVGCLCLPRLLLVFNQAQLLVGSICGLLLVAISTITVPHLTNGSLWMFTLVRFVYGIFMNMVLLETIYIQEAMPEGFGIPALVSINVVFCCVDIFQAYLCGGPMFYWDWRLQAGLLYSVPLVLSLYIGFPNWWDILCSIPNSSKRLFTSEAFSDAAKELHTTLSAKEPKRECLNKQHWGDPACLFYCCFFPRYSGHEVQ